LQNLVQRIQVALHLFLQIVKNPDLSLRRSRIGELNSLEQGG
jgi:hypothetical protein